MPQNEPQLPAFDEALKRLDTDFIIINQGAQALKNRADELKEKILDTVKKVDPALHAEYIKTAAALERADGIFEDITKAAAAYFE